MLSDKTPFFHVYILQSLSAPEHFYTGFCEDYVQRLQEHNAAKVKYTSKFIPWRLKTVISFTDKEQAISFEKYLKSGSGRVFTRKRL